jgi:hypothetical protein
MGLGDEIMKGLIIRAPWIGSILDGAKTWEMRSRPTNVRGAIALIRQGSGLVVGTASLIDSRPPLDRENYMTWRDKHAIPESMLEEVWAGRWIYPWVLSQVRRLSKPVSYRHRSGAVTFVLLDSSVIQAVRSQDADATPAAVNAAAPRARASLVDPAHRVDHAIALAETTSAPVDFGASDEPLFVFRPERAQAYGRPLEDGEFLILKDSTAMRRGSPRVKRDDLDREQLLRDGILVPDADASLYRFAIDWPFSSCSKAAGVIKDGNASGPSLWKDAKTGKSLKEHLKPR